MERSGCRRERKCASASRGRGTAKLPFCVVAKRVLTSPCPRKSDYLDERAGNICKDLRFAGTRERFPNSHFLLCLVKEENGFLDAPKEETAACLGAFFCFRHTNLELTQPRAPLPLMRRLTCCKATFWSPARQLVAAWQQAPYREPNAILQTE